MTRQSFLNIIYIYDQTIRYYHQKIFVHMYFIFLGLFFIYDDNYEDLSFMNDLFLYILVPNFFIIFIPPLAHLKLYFNFTNMGKNNFLKNKLFCIIHSRLFVFIFSYNFFISFSTLLYPSISSAWVNIMAYFSFSSLIFVIITAFLYSYCLDFIKLLSIYVSTSASINALFNIYTYSREFKNIDHLLSIHFWITHRLFASYGIAPWHNENPTGITYCLLLLISTFSLDSIGFNKKTLRIIHFICITILSIATLLSQSRLVIMSFIIIISVYAIMKRKHKVDYREILFNKIKIKSLFFLVFFAYIFSLIYPYLIKIICFRSFGRIEIWSQFIRLILDRPIFGYGQRITTIINTFDNVSVNNPHNVFLAAAIYGGIFAFVSCVFMFVYSLFMSYKIYKLSGAYEPLFLLAFIFICSLADYSLSILSVNWNWLVFWLPIGISLGAATDGRLGVKKMYSS